MHLSIRTAQTMRPYASGSSMMQSSTGQAAWQMEQANAPKQRSGSITAIFFGALLRGLFINLVHICAGIIADFSRRLAAGGNLPHRIDDAIAYGVHLIVEINDRVTVRDDQLKLVTHLVGPTRLVIANRAELVRA